MCESRIARYRRAPAPAYDAGEAVRRPPCAWQPLPCASRARHPPRRTRRRPPRWLAHARGDRKRPLQPLHTSWHARGLPSGRPMARDRGGAVALTPAGARRARLGESRAMRAWGWGGAAAAAARSNGRYSPYRARRQARAGAARTPQQGAAAAGGEVGGGANRVGGEAEEVGRHAGAVGHGLERRGGTCKAQRVL